MFILLEIPCMRLLHNSGSMFSMLVVGMGENKIEKEDCACLLFYMMKVMFRSRITQVSR